MGFETLTGGLALVIPTSGTRNWGTVLRNSTWVKINNHDHTGGGQGNQIPTAGIEDNAVTNDKLSKNLALTQATTLAPTGTTETIDWNLGNKQILDLSSATGNVTLTLSNPITGASYRVKIVQGVTVRTIVWPADVKFQGGEEPTQFQDASDVAIVNLDYDGTNYYANWEIGLA